MLAKVTAYAWLIFLVVAILWLIGLRINLG
jgi:hypothetical protein